MLTLGFCHVQVCVRYQLSVSLDAVIVIKRTTLWIYNGMNFPVAQGWCQRLDLHMMLSGVEHAWTGSQAQQPHRSRNMQNQVSACP